MIDEWRNCFESAPGANVSWWFSMYRRPEWVGVMVVVGCVAGRAGGREKGGVGVGCVGIGGVCGWERPEEGGGRRRGRGRGREGN